MKLTRRSAFGWGSSGAGHATPRKGLVIHYDGSNQGLAGKSHSSCVAYWQSTRRFHMGPSRRWADIGYSFGACPHGYVLEGRGLNRIQAAQPGGNDTWYSVTLMSGPGEDPTPAQIEAVRQLRAWLMGKGVAGAVKGHRDFISTSCPGDRLYRLVRDGTFGRAPSKSSKEDDMPSEKDIWTWDGIEAPVNESGQYLNPKNPKWRPDSYLRETYMWVRRIQREQAATQAAVAELSRTVAQLAADRGQVVDADALVARIGEQIERVTVRLDVQPDAEDAS